MTAAALCRPKHYTFKALQVLQDHLETTARPAPHARVCAPRAPPALRHVAVRQARLRCLFIASYSPAPGVVQTYQQKQASELFIASFTKLPTTTAT